MPTSRLAYTNPPASQPASGGVAYKANSYNCSNATSKVVSLNGTWKTDSISFTVDPLYRYTVHVRNSSSFGTTTINIDYIQVYGEASASYLTCIEDSGGYRFGFNSMPKDNEIYDPEGSAYDFGARIYDSRLGRWMATDALANINPGSSPFRYAKNSPLLYLDEGGYFDIKVTKAAREKFGITKQQLKRMDQVLRAMPTYLKDNPQVVAIVSKQTGLSPEQIMADAEYGKGPVILVDFTPETQRKGMF